MYIAKEPGNRYVVTAVTKDSEAFLNALYEAYELLLYRKSCQDVLEDPDHCIQEHSDEIKQSHTE